MQMNQQKEYISQFLPRLVSDTNDMSTTSFNVNSDTTTCHNNNNNSINRDEQCPKVTLNINERTAMKTTNVDDRRENQSGREKGERETREDDVKRTPTMREQERERIPQTKKNIDLVTSFTSEQYDCPNVNDSMTNLVSSSFNSNNNHQNSSLTTNRSRCSSSNSYPTYSMNHTFRTYEPPYSPIPRYSTSSSPYRKTHYLDASDEEVIKEEILEITNLNHYPTLLERWGDDTKTIIREEGEFKIEDYVEFEEIDPTITEEIFYEIIYSGGQIKSTREIHRTRSQSRNFRKIKKRRIKRKRTTQLSNEIYNLSDKLNSVIQIGDRISTTNDDSSGDNHEITTTESIIRKQTNENIPSNINGDRYPNTDIIGKDTSLQFSKSDEQKKDLYDRIKEKTNGFHPSCFISTQDDHEIISIEKSSINEEQTNISKVDQGIKHTSDGDQQTFFSHPIINSEELDSTKNTEKQALTDALVELTREIRAISLITHVPSTENTTETTHFWKQEIEESSIDFSMKNEKEKTTFINKTIPDKNEQVSFEALTEAVQEILATSSLTTQEQGIPDNISAQIQRPDLQMLVSTSVIADEEDTSSVKRRLSSEDKSNETEIEQHPSSNALTDTFRKILSTLPPLYLSSTDHTMEMATQLDQINTKDNELLESTMNSTGIEDQHLPSNASTEVDCPLSEIKTEITESVEQEVENLSIDSLVEIIQQIKAIPSQSISKTEENTIQYPHEDTKQSSSIIILTTIEAEQKPFYDREQITVPFGSPAEINTETRSSKEETYAVSTTNLSAVVDKQPETISTQSMTRIPPEQELNISDNETAITIDGQSSLIARTDEDKNVELSSDFLPDIIRQIKTTASSIYRPLVQHNKQVVEKSNNDILTEITEQISLTSIPLTNIEDKKNENDATHLSSNVLTEAASVDIKSSSDCVIENVPQAFTSPIQSVLHINESKSSAINSNSQSRPESSIQDNVLHRSELLPPPIVTDSSSSIITNEQLHDENKNSIADTYKTFPLSTEINPINQTAPEPFYSISELINIMNTILNLPTQIIPENNTNILQELETREQTSSSNLSIVQTSTASDTDFGNFYHHHNLPTTIVEQTLSNFNSIDTEQSIEKKDIPELLEQRHIQSSFDDQQLEQKQITTDVHDHVEYLNLKSFPLISNLPSRKYRPVFGMPDELDNTFDDSTYYIDQTFPSKISDEVKLNISDSFEESQLIETVKNDLGIRPLDEKEILHEPTRNIISNLHSAFPSSLRHDRTDTLIEPLLDLRSPSLIAANATHMDEQSIRLQHERFNPKEDISAATAHFQSIGVLPSISPDQSQCEANIHPSQQEETLIHNTINILKESLNDLIENIRLNIETNEEDTVINAPAHQQISEQINEQNDSSSLISYTTPVVTGVTFDIASNGQLPTTNELIKISSDAAVIDDTDIQSQLSTNIHQFTCSAESIKANDEVLASNVTDNEVLVSGSFEQLLTQLEDDQQQQPLSGSLLQIMNHLTPSTLRSTMSADRRSQSIQSIEKAPSKADTVEKLIDEKDSHHVITTLTSVLSKTLSIVQNVSSASTNLNTGTNRQAEISETSLQSSTTNKQQHQDDVVARPISNVKETISDLVSSDQTTTSLESSLNLPGESCNHTQHSKDLEHDEQQQTFNQNLTEVANNKNENITSTQQQQTQIQKQPIFGNYPWYSSQYKVAATKSEHLCSTHQSSTDDHKQEEVEPKVFDQELQVISDDYPWYSNYYSIVDAEAKIAELQQQLNITIDQPPLPQKHELQDEDGFHVVQRRKRIPSSTTHGKTLSSTIVTTEPTLSPDIDLEPIILHGQPGASTIIPSNVTQTSSIISKKKHKKKKKDKKEMILFDAPEPTLSDINTLDIGTVQSEKLGEKHGVNNEMTTSSVIHQTIQSIVSNEKEIFNQHTSNITSTVELESQSINQSKASNTEEEEYEHHTSDHANILDDVANENHTVNTIDATDQSTQFTHEEQNHRTSLLLDQTKIESNIESNQQEETSIHNKISSFKESLQHLIENIRLNIGKNEEADAINAPAHEQIIEQTNEQNDSSSVMDSTTPVVTDIASNITNNLPLTTTHKGTSIPSDAVVIDDKDVQSQLPSNVIDNQVLVSGPSEVLSTKLEDDQQQQPLSTGLSQIMHNLLPSIEKAQPEEGMVEKLVDENESSNVITKLKSVLNGVSLNVQNVSSASTTSNTETAQEAEISTTSLQSSAINEEQHHDVFDAVARAISNVKDTILEFSPDLPDGSCNHTQQSNDLDDDERQQTFDQTLTEFVKNTNENITSTQEQQTQIQRKPIFGNYPWYSSQYKVAATESERLFSTHQSSTDDHKQQEGVEPKVSDQELQVISDDYPWYSNYYSIVDAEAKIAQLQQQLNITIDQSPLPQEHELEKEDEDGFHVVQRRKRIPSSTAQEKTLSSTILTTEPSLSPDIDLEPIILHGHPSASIIISSNVPETTSIISKNKPKKKKKKKDKKEMILFDAPEPTLSDMNKQQIDTVQACRIEEEEEENKSQENDGRIDSSLMDQIVKHEVEDLHLISTVIYNEQKSEILSTSIILNTEELTAIDDNNNESTPADDSHLRNSPAPTFPEDIEVNSEAVEMIALSKEEEEDNEGFQLVCHHKRIRSAIRSEKASPSSNTTSKQILTSNIKMETPTTTSAVSEITGSEKKRNRHKKHKKESKSSSSNDWTKTEQQPTDQQTVFQSSVPSSSVNEDSREQSTKTVIPIVNAMKINTKTSTSDKEEEKGEDNEGFQVVRYRKRIKSAPRSEKAQVSSSAKITYRQNISRDMAFKPTVIHGRPDSAPRSISHTTVVTGTRLNKNKQARLKQQKKQTSLISTPPRLPSTETHIKTSTDAGDTFETPTKIEPSVSPTEQSIKQIVKEYRMSTENQIKTTDQQSSIDEITTATTSSPTNTDIGKSTLIEDGDDDEFQVVLHPKHTLSSTDTDVKHDSSTSITIPTTATSKKNSKKPKQNKKHTLPSLTTDVNQNEGDNVQAISQSEIVAENNSSSKSDEVPSMSTTHDIVTSQINASLQQTDNTQSPIQSIKSIALLTTVDNEVSTPSNELPSKVDHFSIPEPVRSISLSQPPSIDNLSTSNQTEKTETSPTTLIEPPAHIEDEQIKTASNKKSAKRRKTKPHTNEKPNDENVLTSSKHFIHTNPESNLRRSDDEKQASDRTTTHPSSPSQPTHLIQVKYPYEEINSKLDLFLPEYIREQLNTSQTSSSSRTPSIDSPNLTPITTSSNSIQKKKQRPKMLTKDHEAKSLLTNEFDNTTNSEKELNQTIILTDDENIHDDDDEFIIQTFHSHKTEEELTNISTQETFENVLSRGFYLWLQASQALSQHNDTSSSFNSDLTNAMQSIVIQPTETDDDEDSWEAYHDIKSTYMIGVRSEKRIHITHAYLINHPETISIPSWLIVQSNDNTFQDDSEKFDSDDEEYSITDTSKKRNSIQTNTQLLTMKNRQSNSNNDNHTINFDDWAHFLEHKNSYYIKNDLSTFYTRPFDDDTLISEATPIYDSIKHKRQRYGDFLLSNNDIITPETTIKFPVYKSKPSEYFQNYRKQEITSRQYDNDDEIFISHSNNGLSRQMKP